MNKWIKYEMLKKQIVTKSPEDYERQIRVLIKLLNI